MNNSIIKKILILTCLLALFAWADIGRAADVVNIVLIPQHPDPGTQMKVRVESFSYDVDRSDIVWKVGGKTVDSGSGVTTAVLVSPEQGESKQVIVYITTAEGQQVSRSIVLVGNGVDLLWEALTYVPVWYEGKALPVRGANVKVSAIPYLYSNGKLLSRNNLLYEWYSDYKKDFGASGMGKDSFIFKMKNYNKHTVVVRVTSQDGNVVFEKAIMLSVNDIEPKIVFYEESPLEGIRYNRALKENFSLERGDLGLKAEPYFVSSESLSSLSYAWKMNGGTITPEGFSNSLSLRAQGGGASLIKVEIMNLRNLLQSAQEAIRIVF